VTLTFDLASSRKRFLAVPMVGAADEQNAPVTADDEEGIALRIVGDKKSEGGVEGKTEEQLVNGGNGRGVRRCRRLLGAFRRRQAERADGKSTATGSGGAGADTIVAPTGRSRSSTPSLTVKECKATRTLGVIMGAFTACWLPFFAMLESTDIPNTRFNWHTEQNRHTISVL